MPLELVAVLIWGFTFFLVGDVLRRRERLWWVAVILLTRPYGGIVYLLYLKLRDSPRFRELLGPAAASRPSTSEAPASRRSEAALEIADQLEEQRRFGEAALIYERALEQRTGDPRALHGLGRCLVELDQTARAIELYETLMAIDPRFRNYSAALEYAEALHRGGRTQDATGLLEGLVQETKRPNHHLALANYLELSGQAPRAKSVLNDALHAFERSSPPEQEANRRWQRRILDKLDELTTTN
jgi:hypothetical protein